MMESPNRIFHISPKSALLLKFHHDEIDDFVLSVPKSQLHTFTSINVEEIFIRLQNSTPSYQKKDSPTLLAYLKKEEIKSADPPKIHESPDRYKRNRLIYGDCLQGMTALFDEGYQNQVQMIYLDPPFGIEYNAEFYSGTQKVEGYKDKWVNGLESYLDFLRLRLYLARELLHQSGSIFVQISDRNVHYVRYLLDEIFGTDNWINQIMFRTAISTNRISSVGDYLLWYAKDKKNLFKRELYVDRPIENRKRTFTYTEVKMQNHEAKNLYPTEREIPQVAFKPQELVKRITNEKESKKHRLFTISWQGRSYLPPEGFEWRWDEPAIIQLIQEGRVCDIHGKLYGKRYEEDFPAMLLTNMWTDTATSTFAAKKHYTVHTNPKVIQRCIALATRPGDLILDPMIGSGTTAVIAEQMGRHWIGFDTSPTAILGSLNWLLGSDFPVYSWDATTSEFEYEPLRKHSLSRIVHMKHSEELCYYDRPHILNPHGRHTLPFTFEFIDSISDTKNPREQLVILDQISSVELIFPDGNKYTLSIIETVSIDEKNLPNPNVRIVHAQLGDYTMAIILCKWGIILEPTDFLTIYKNYRKSNPNNCCIVAVSGITPIFWQDPTIRDIFAIERPTMCILAWYSADLSISQLQHTNSSISLNVSGILRIDQEKELIHFSTIHSERPLYRTLSSELLATWGIMEMTFPFNIIYYQLPLYRKFLNKDLRPLFDRPFTQWIQDLSQFNDKTDSSTLRYLLWGIDARGTFHFGWNFSSIDKDIS